MKDKYDNGNNDWLCHKNKSGEYAVAYIGINNKLNDKEQMIEDLGNISQNIDMIKNKLYRTDINLRKINIGKKIIGGIGMVLSLSLAIINFPLGLAAFAGSSFLYQISDNCGDGVSFFQNPKYAENSDGFIDILGFRIKIILMCRVNPKKN